MWIKKHMYFVVAILLIAYVLALVLITGSFGPQIVNRFCALTGIGGTRVTFSGGTSFKADAESISVVLQDGETSLLSGFTGLRSADFTGSECVEEIAEWSRKNPAVNVKYTVELPDGQVLPNDTVFADLTGITRDKIAATAEKLKCFPQLAYIDLGNSETSPEITAEDISAFSQAYPSADVSYKVSVLGREYALNEKAVDLSGMKTADIPAVTEKLALLTDLESVTIGENATVNGELSWADISSIAAVNPDAALNYTFTVLGNKASLADKTLDLQTITPADVAAVAEILPGMTQLERVDIGSDASGLSWDDISKLYAAAPDAVFDYDMNLWGKSFSLADEVLDFNHVMMPDGGALIKSVIPFCRNCKQLDMDFCGKGDEFNQLMQSIRDENPDIEVIWRVWFGENYSVRTNVTKILASKPSKGGKLYNSDAQQLKYCTNVRYLDVGHNDTLSDFSFVASMPDLEIVVMSMCGVSDLTPFAACTHLKYIEAGNTGISDLTPLANCTELAHLNIGTCPGVTDLSPLFDLPLRRLWLCTNTGTHCTNYSSAQAEEFIAAHPDCEVNTTCPTGYGNADDAEGYVKEGWKYWQQYLTSDWNVFGNTGNFPPQRPLGYWKVVYKAFEYNLGETAYAFSWNDPKYDEHDASVEPVNTHVINTSQLSEAWTPPEDDIVEDVLADPPGEILYTIGY